MNDLLDKERSVLLIIDIQEKFRNTIPDLHTVIRNTLVLIKAAELLGIPVIVSEQYPQGLGRTVPELTDALTESTEFYEKTSFGCCGSKEICNALAHHHHHGRSQIIVTGIETHICVNQTVLQLLTEGYSVHIIANAVSSRKEFNKDIGIGKMMYAGAIISSMETALFELIRDASDPSFKILRKLIV